MVNLMDDLVAKAVEYQSVVRRGPKSTLNHIINELQEQDLLEDALERAFKVLETSDLENSLLASIARRVATSMANTAGVPVGEPKATIKCGIEILDWFADLGVIKAEKRKQIKEDNKGAKAVDVWVLVPCMDFGKGRDEEQIFCDPRKPYIPWLSPTRFDSGVTIPIVKRAEQYKLLPEYTPEKIPLLYAALNRIGNAQWEVNMDLFEYANDIEEHNSPLPAMPSEEDVSRAQNTMRNVKASKKRRGDAYKTIGAKEKRKAFEEIMKKAWQYQGHTLQFPHNLCGRGRIYALSPILNPQGADIAKALLVLKEKRPLVKREFFIHLANCAGVDKETYDDREKWVEDHYGTLVSIGSNPIRGWSLIKSLGVHKEKKTYYQFIASCIELAKWDANPDHKTGMLLGLDSTSSGNQILAMIARDHEVAEYVNISMTDSGKPGDLYAYVGKFVKDALQQLTLKDVPAKMKIHVNMEAIGNLAALPKGHKTFRKITKRICMVLPYSGTRYGSGEIMKDDQFDHGSDVVEELNFADCSVTGALIHDCCRAAAKRSMGLMEYMTSNLETSDVLVTWRVPQTNFLAFQTKEKMREDALQGTIGDKKVTVTYYAPTGKGNIIQHRNAISPGMVHSLDAAMLALIINGIPTDLPVSAIHDQFCVPFGHMDVLVESARQAYAAVADRDAFKALASSAFGKEVELPEPGKWRLDDLKDSEYFIC